MRLIERIEKKSRDIAAVFYRKKIVAGMQVRLQNHSVSIIASNCIGGILCHDLGLRFNSPTINLFFEPSDFVKYCSDLDGYAQYKLILDEKMTAEKGYPVALLGDIRLYGVHYQNIEEMQVCWERRTQRICKDNLFVVMTDRNGMTDEDVCAFSQVPYPKVLFTVREYPEFDFVVTVKDFAKESQVGQMQFFADFKGHRYYEKWFDFVGWFNHEKV